MKTIINIEGMSCSHCTSSVTESLMKIQGVEAVDVSLEERRAIVEHLENVSVEVMINEIEEQGFEASII